MTTLAERAERAALPDPDARGWVAGARRLVVRTVVDTIDDRVPGLAAEMAFYVVLSLPPLLLVVFGSLGFVVGSLPAAEVAQLQDGILQALSTVLSSSTVDETLAAPVGELLRSGRSDVLSIGIVLTLWSASRSANVLLRTIVTAYDLDEHRTAWRRRGLAIGLTLAGVTTAVVVLPLLVVGPDVLGAILDGLGGDPALARFWSVAYWPAIMGIGLAGLTAVYHVAPGRRTPWRRDLPGAVLALVIWVGASAGIRVYSAQFATFSTGDTFRGLAAPLVLLLWAWATSVAVLIGAELNAEIDKLWPVTDPSDWPRDDPTPPLDG